MNGLTLSNGNYALDQVSRGFMDALITPRIVSVSTLLGSSLTKVYDGTDLAPVGFAVATSEDSGVLLDDVVEVTFAEASFNSADVLGADRIIVNGLTLSNGNYALDQAARLFGGASITPRTLALTGSFAVADRIEDGTTLATIQDVNLELANLVEGETFGITGLVGAFQNPGPGTDILVNLTAAALDDEAPFSGKATNYQLSLADAPTATASIRPLPSPPDPAPVSEIEGVLSELSAVTNLRPQSIDLDSGATATSGTGVDADGDVSSGQSDPGGSAAGEASGEPLNSGDSAADEVASEGDAQDQGESAETAGAESSASGSAAGTQLTDAESDRSREGDAGAAGSLGRALESDDPGLAGAVEEDVEVFASPVPDTAEETPVDAEDEGDGVLALLNDGDSEETSVPAARPRQTRTSIRALTRDLNTETPFSVRPAGTGSEYRLPGRGNL